MDSSSIFAPVGKGFMRFHFCGILGCFEKMRKFCLQDSASVENCAIEKPNGLEGESPSGPKGVEDIGGENGILHLGDSQARLVSS